MTTPLLPYPVAVLQRRSHNAKSAKDLHDAAYFAWEVSVRLAVALEGGAGQTGRSVGAWVKSLDRSDARLEGAPLREVARLLGAEGLGRPLGGRETSARGILDALPAYRNRVIGHGSIRASGFYERAGRVLLHGLDAAWSAGVFWPAGVTLCHVDSVQVEDGGAHRARVLDLQGIAPLVRDPAGTFVPEDVRPGRLYAHRPDAESTAPRWTALHPWLLYLDEDGRERVLCFDALLRTHARYLDYATGSVLSGRALEEAAPGTFEALQAALGDADASAETTHGDGAGEGEEPFGDYVILGRIGQGAMGVVYLARQRGLGRHVALKMLPAATAENSTALARFQREVVALSRCEHPNVVKILDYGSVDGTHYYAMEYVEGAPLSAVAKALTDTGDLSEAISSATAKVRAEAPERYAHVPEIQGAEAHALPVRDRWRHLARLFQGIALGLHHLHEAGVVHRDVKPENIIVTARDHRAVVMDLGLAQLEDASQALTREDHGILGTLRYMPPEQLRMDLADIDRRADIYAVGATLFELATGRAMLDGDSVPRLVEQILHATPATPRRLVPAIPRDLEAIIVKATAKDAESRHATALELARDLDAYAEGRAVSAQPATLGYLLRLAVRRHRALAIGSAVVLLLLVGGGIWFIQHLRGVRDREHDLRQEAEAALVQSKQLARSLASEKQAAESARSHAEAHLRRAEDLALYVLDDLTTGLEAVGQLPLLSQTARRVKAWYDQVDTPDAAWITRRGRALALERVGMVLQAEGDLEGATSAYAESVALLRQRVADAPDDLQAVMRLGGVEASLAGSHERAGRYEKVQALLRQAIARLTPLVGRPDITQGDVLFHLARAHADLGGALDAQARNEDALEQIDRAVELSEKRLASGARPDDAFASILYLRAGTLMRSGLTKRAFEDATRGLRMVREALADQEARGIENQVTLRYYAYLLSRLGRIERERGNPAQEDAHLKASLAVRERLAANDPTNVDARRSLAESQLNQGRRKLDQKRPTEALVWLRKAKQTLGKLADDDPTDATNGFDAAVTDYYLAWAASDLRDWKAAGAHLDEMERRLNHVLAAGSTDAKLSYGLYLAIEARHNHAWKQGDMKRARALAPRTLERIRVVAARDPSNAHWQESLAKAHRRVADHRALAGEHEAAIPDFEAAIRILDRLLARDPDANSTQGRRIATIANLSFAYMFVGDLDAARAQLARARKLLLGIERIPVQTGAAQNVKAAETALVRIEAAAPLRSGARKPTTPEDHVLLALDAYERSQWVRAAQFFRKALGPAADALPKNVESLEIPIHCAAQAVTGDVENAASWRTLALAWIRAALAATPSDERRVLAARFSKDRLLRPLRMHDGSKQVLEKLLATPFGD